VEEFKTAFITKGEKIPRTPPEEQMRDQNYDQNEPFYRDSPQHHYVSLQQIP